MVKLRATREVYYASKTRNTGDEFDASESDARLLVGLEKAVLVEETPKPKPAPQTLQTRELKAEEEKPAPQPMTTDNSEAVTTGRSRRYMRRDMRAKE